MHHRRTRSALFTPEYLLIPPAGWIRATPARRRGRRFGRRGERGWHQAAHRNMSHPALQHAGPCGKTQVTIVPHGRSRHALTCPLLVSAARCAIIATARKAQQAIFGDSIHPSAPSLVRRRILSAAPRTRAHHHVALPRPRPGCSVQITAGDLRDDPEYAKRVARQLRRKESNLSGDDAEEL